MFDALEITKRLIEFPSVTPDEAGVMDYVQGLLENNGFKFMRKVYETHLGPATAFYAVKGERGRNLCFSGHIDVVPPGDLSQWQTDPFRAIEREGKLYGRGACDMKGGVGASLAAALNYEPQEGQRVSIMLTSDEEDGGLAVQLLLKDLEAEGEKIDFAIIAEPTSKAEFGDEIKVGRRGSVSFNITVKGKQGHVAYPHHARNPNAELVRGLNALLDYSFDKGNDYFQATNLEIVSLDVGNKIPNLIPSKASAEFNVRFNDIHDSLKIEEVVVSVLQKHITEFDIKKTVHGESFFVKPTKFVKEFAQLVEKFSGTEPKLSTTGGTSDARFIQAYSPLLEFGVLNSTAHKIDEFVQIEDLQTLYNVYYYAIVAFFAESH